MIYGMIYGTIYGMIYGTIYGTIYGNIGILRFMEGFLILKYWNRKYWNHPWKYGLYCKFNPSMEWDIL